jgi:VWFA-related protein
MRRKGQTLGSIMLVMLLLMGRGAGAQDFKIRARVDLVVVPVTVKDSEGKFVTGLRKDDFVLVEDGQRQTITNFTVDPVPLSAAVIVDTGLSSDSLSKVQNTVAALSGAFSEFDEIAVYRYDKYIEQVLDFSPATGEHIQIAMNMLRNVKPSNAKLEPNIWRGPFAVPGPVINGFPVVPPGQLGVNVTSPPKASFVLNDAIFAAAEDLARRDRTRRKVVLIVSDGESSGNVHSFDDARKSLLEKNIQVYAVGLDQPFPYKKVSPLADYAKATGGDVIFADSVKDIENAYSTITEEARNQYVLGYLSNNEVAGPGPVFRQLDVSVAGTNLKVIHRRGYYQYP